MDIEALIVFVARLTTDTLFPISLDTYPYGCAEAARAVAAKAMTRKQDTLIALSARIDVSPLMCSGHSSDFKLPTMLLAALKLGPHGPLSGRTWRRNRPFFRRSLVLNFGPVAGRLPAGPEVALRTASMERNIGNSAPTMAMHPSISLAVS
jgi:hypothetical protein